MEGTRHFHSFAVHAQHVGRRTEKGRAEPRVVMLVPGSGALRLLLKSSVVLVVRTRDVHAILYDEAEPSILMLMHSEQESEQEQRRLLLEFASAEENLLFRCTPLVSLPAPADWLMLKLAYAQTTAMFSGWLSPPRQRAAKARTSTARCFMRAACPRRAACRASRAATQ